MGRRGPAPKPSKVVQLHGNPGKRAINKNEPQPTPTAPKCPAWLDTEAKREWKRVAPELERLGLLTQVDGSSLAAYCQAYATMVHANKAIRDHYKVSKKLTVTYTNNDGYENEVPLPEIRIAGDQARLVRAFCVEFGLTPSARGRMEVPGSKNPEEEYERYRRRGKATGA